jgi:hypothetical protein
MTGKRTKRGQLIMLSMADRAGTVQEQIELARMRRTWALVTAWAEALHKAVPDGGETGH